MKERGQAVEFRWSFDKCQETTAGQRAIFSVRHLHTAHGANSFVSSVLRSVARLHHREGSPHAGGFGQPQL